MTKVCAISIIINIFFYTTVLVFGYLTCFTQCPDLVINYYKNLIFTILKIFLAVNQFFAFPFNLQPAKEILFELVNKKTQKWNTLFILNIYIISAGVAIFYPGLKSFFSFLGGIFGTFLVVFFPALCYLKLYNKNKFIIMIQLIVVLVFGLTGAIVS